MGRTARGRRGGNLGRVSELEVQIWVNGPGRRPEDMDGVVRDLVGEVNFIALHNEASGLDEGLPPDLPAIDRLSEVRAPALILVGNSNQLRTLAAADLLASELLNARKVVMTGAARLRNMERPKNSTDSCWTTRRTWNKGNAAVRD